MARHSRQPSRPRRRTLAGTIVQVLALVIVLAVVGGAAASWYFLERSETHVKPGQSVQVEIPEGADTARIGEILVQRGVVGNALRFRFEVRRADAGSQLRAGIYDLTTGMPYDAVIERLKAGPPIAYVTLTIPEGFTVDQIAARVEALFGIPASDFLALAKGGSNAFSAAHPYLKGAYNGSLEGYLFPKTYRIPEGATAEEIIETLLAQFDKETAGLSLKVAQRNGLDLADVVTIASMIEREARLDKERALVSSVIYNRLRRDMRLEIDATIEYVLPGNRFRLRSRDLQLDSPYNTYRNAGLPPGPISNPGLASLKAACAPADTKYVYYVLTGKDGSHTFARTFVEFQAAKAESKRVFGR